jgi:hypothetical protein
VDGLGTRIALNKMDWDQVSAVDLLALFSSLCSGDKIVHRVEIYPSLFGLERMKEENVNGPPRDIFDVKEEDLERINRKKAKKQKLEESESDSVERLKEAGFEEEDDEGLN